MNLSFPSDRAFPVACRARQHWVSLQVVIDVIPQTQSSLTTSNYNYNYFLELGSGIMLNSNHWHAIIAINITILIEGN